MFTFAEILGINTQMWLIVGAIVGVWLGGSAVVFALCVSSGRARVNPRRWTRSSESPTQSTQTVAFTHTDEPSRSPQSIA